VTHQDGVIKSQVRFSKILAEPLPGPLPKFYTNRRAWFTQKSCGEVASFNLFPQVTLQPALNYRWSRIFGPL